MKKLPVILTAFIMAISSLCFIGCGDPPPPNNQSDIVKYDGNYNFKIVGSSNENNITLDVSNVSQSDYAANETLDIVMLKPYEYYNGEKERGIYFERETSDQGEIIGTYNVDNEKTITIDRFTTEGYDNLYNKFILAKDGNLAAGPFFVSNIESERNYEQKITATTKKGILSQGNDELLNLGVG